MWNDGRQSRNQTPWVWLGEVNLINWKNILKHNKDRKYQYIHVESVQVQIAPLQYYTTDIDHYALLCRIKHNKFNNQTITGLRPICVIEQ